MNRYHTLRLRLPAFIILALVLSACGSKAIPTVAANEPTGPVLKLIGPNGGRALTMTDLKALPVTEGMGGIKSSTGKITIPESYRGIAIKVLVAALGSSFDQTMGVTLTAEDGYSMTYSYDQVVNGVFTAYDPANGNELATHDPLTVILAYERNGQPLDTNSEGNLRLAVVSAKNNQVVDGQWSVKWVNQMEVKPVGQTWTLDLEGAIKSPVDRASYQSCGAPSCHGTSWVDENEQNWVGVPLWLLVGEVDDANSHLENAYNDSLAESGYLVDIISSDGTTLTFDSKSIKRDNNIQVAFLVNEAELPEQYYPLRLVGPGVGKSEMMGQIEKIEVHVPPAPTPTVTPAATIAVTGDLSITGMVVQELSLTEADLHALEVIHITADTPKKVIQDFEGIRLNALLDQANIKDGATKVIFFASDGFSAEINLADLQACNDCLLAFTEIPGRYSTVMPGLLGNNWVKNVIKIEVK